MKSDLVALRTSYSKLYILIIFIAVYSFSGYAKPDSPSYKYDDISSQLFNLKADHANVAQVENLSFSKDAAHFYLTQGKLYVLSQIGGRQAALLFLGDGHFSFTPPTKIEQEQLHRYYETKRFDHDFKALFIIFTDSTLDYFKKKLTFSAELNTPDISNHINNCLEYISDKKENYIHADLAKTYLNEGQYGLFYSQFYNSESNPFFFEILPFEKEEVRFSHKAETGHMERHSEVVCQFESQQEIKNHPARSAITKEFFHVDEYVIDATIDSDLNFFCCADMTLTMLQDNQRWISFYIFKEMIIDSISNSAGNKLIFHKSKKHSSMLIDLGIIPKISEQTRIKIYYHTEKLLERDEEAQVYFRSSIMWYPNPLNRNYAKFDITFHHPSKWDLISVGERINTEKGKEITTSRWVTKSSIRNASFNIGYYETHTIREEGLPEIIVLKAKGGHTWASGNMEKEVGGDVQNSMRFFKHVFGEVSLDHFYISEIPYSHGEAFPGLIHLAWSTFQETDYRGYDEIFRAHEVAHQWWPIEVDFDTYHDQWLSEGMASFAGLWYMQMILKDNKKYFKVLDDWRERIMKNRDFLLSKGQEAGPVSLGYRTHSSKTAGDFNTIIYLKGAWILHMLRNMMLDLQTMNEDRFANMLREFYSQNRRRKVTTADFQKTVEKYMGQDMNWFFEQWIYYTDIPNYTFAYNTSKTADGKTMLNCKIKQTGVLESFQMPVIIKIDFGADRFARISKKIKGPITDFSIKLPFEPKEVTFNYLESVLAEVDNISYSDF